MQTQDLIKGLWKLARRTPEHGNKGDEDEIIEVLDALITSGDLTLMEVTPVFLALSAQSGFSLNISPLLHKYGLESRQSETLEKFIWVALELLKAEGLGIPADVQKQAKRLKTKWGSLESSGHLELGWGISLQMDRLRNVFRQYMTSPPEFTRIQEEPWSLASPSSHLHRRLSILFSPKQEELIMKKLKGAKFSKTEREYYSRVVKKKLQALADKSVQELVTKLIPG
ncbi:MAG: hypothetical protein R6U38_06815 [Desulfatiglandaceae bacterium]